MHCFLFVYLLHFYFIKFIYYIFILFSCLFIYYTLQDDLLDPSAQFLQSDAKKVKKKILSVRIVLVIILIILAAVAALLTGVLVWNFHCEYSLQTICRSTQNHWLNCIFLNFVFLSHTVRTDVRIKKVFAGSLTVANLRFIDPYEDDDSAHFKDLASDLSKQVSHVHPNCFNLLFKHLPYS